MTDYMMEYLGEAEGLEIHRNSSEDDITTMYGIYRVSHPGAKIFKVIDTIAEELGLNLDSSTWDSTDIQAVNSYASGNGFSMDLKEAAMEFYDDFLKPLHLDLFPEDSQIAAFSLYTNSPQKAIISIQAAINKMITNKKIQNNLLVCDGAFGGMSRSAVAKIEPHDGLLFEAYMLLYMSKQYAILAVTNPDKYLRYLNGWNNRLDLLAKS